MLRRAAVAEQPGRLASGPERAHRRGDAAGIRTDEHVPPRLHRLRPLRRVTERDAGPGGEERLLLDPARVGDDDLGVELEDQHLEVPDRPDRGHVRDRKSTRLNSSHMSISYAVFCLKKKKSTI